MLCFNFSHQDSGEEEDNDQLLSGSDFSEESENDVEDDYGDGNGKI